MEVARVYVADDFILRDKYIDPAKWSPLIHNFRHYFRLADQELGKTFCAEAQKTKRELQTEHPAQFRINRRQMRIGMMM